MQHHLRIIAILAFFAAVPVASASGIQNRVQCPQLAAETPNVGLLFALLFGGQSKSETVSIKDTAGPRDQTSRPLSRKTIRATTSCSVC